MEGSLAEESKVIVDPRVDPSKSVFACKIFSIEQLTKSV